MPSSPPGDPPWAAMARFVPPTVFSPVQHSGGAQPMPTPTPKSRMSLARLARHGGLRKIHAVDYDISKIRKALSVRQAPAQYDLDARRTVVDLYKRRKAAAGRPVVVESLEGQLICRVVAAVVFPDKQNTENERKTCVQFVRRWAARWEADKTVDLGRNRAGGGGADNRQQNKEPLHVRWPRNSRSNH